MSEPILLCRTADSLYWVGRYLERAESLARLVVEHTALLMDLPRSVALTWEPLLAIPGADHGFWSRYQSADERSVMAFLLHDEGNGSSLARSVRLARENLRVTRQVFPRASWRLVNELAQAVADPAAGQRRGRRHQLLERVMADCQQLAGVIGDAMRRDHAYDFFHVGTQLERADMTTRVLDVRAASLMEVAERSAADAGEATQAVFEDVQWLGVLRSLLGVHAFRRSTSEAVSGDAVVRFLLADDRFPRSIAFCLDEVDSSIQHLPKNLAVLEACREARVLLGRAEARSWRAEDLRNLADDVQLALARVDSALATTYFEDDEAVPEPAAVAVAVAPPSQSQSQSSSPPSPAPAGSANGQPGK